MREGCIYGLARRGVTFDRPEEIQVFFHGEGGEEDVLLGADAGQTADLRAVARHGVAVDRALPVCCSG